MIALRKEVVEYDDFMLLEEEYSKLPYKTLAFFKAAYALYDSDFYVKANDDIYMRPDHLSLLFVKEHSHSQTYLGCMKKGPIFTDPKLKCYGIVGIFACLKEISLGIIGNLACHEVTRRQIASKVGLIEIIVEQLFLENAPCLCEAFQKDSVNAPNCTTNLKSSDEDELREIVDESFTAKIKSGMSMRTLLFNHRLR